MSLHRGSPGSLLPVLLLLAPLQPALAGGGPVQWSRPTLFGGLSPLENPWVELVSEEVRIALEPDGEHYRLRARYQLRNRAEPTRVVFGVPLASDGRDQAKGGALDSAPRVTLGGRPARGTLALRPERPWSPEEPDPLEPVRGDQPVSFPWYVVELPVPRSESLTLELTYRGSLFFVDWTSEVGPLPARGRRELRFPFLSGGAWEGPCGRLDLEVDLGVFADLVEGVQPDQAQRLGRRLRLDGSGVDLSNQLPLSVAVATRAVADNRVLVGMNTTRGNPIRRLVARSSSQLAPQGGRSYQAGNAVDGRAETAWCEGQEGDGVGSWLELAWQCRPASGGNAADEACIDRQAGRHLMGLVVLPGYARTQATYLDNNRVSALRVGPCGQPEGGQVVELPQGSTDVLRAAVLVRGLPEEGLERCARFTIEKVVPGARFHDTCIGELAPLFEQVN